MERGKGDEKGGHGENVPHTATQNTKVLPGTSARNVRYIKNRRIGSRNFDSVLLGISRMQDSLCQVCASLRNKTEKRAIEDTKDLEFAKFVVRRTLGGR